MVYAGSMGYEGASCAGCENYFEGRDLYPVQMSCWELCHTYTVNLCWECLEQHTVMNGPEHRAWVRSPQLHLFA